MSPVGLAVARPDQTYHGEHWCILIRLFLTTPLLFVFKIKITDAKLGFDRLFTSFCCILCKARYLSAAVAFFRKKERKEKEKKNRPHAPNPIRVTGSYSAGSHNLKGEQIPV